jgi:hypothetical protein
MVERVAVDLIGGRWTLLGAVFRYDVMERIAKAAVEQDVKVLAFGFGEADLRLVLEGGAEPIARLLRAVKVGTVRAARRWGMSLRSGGHLRTESDDLQDAVAWAHLAPVEAGASDPLASPWSSHRDVLGYRAAPFFDASHVRDRIDLRRLHRQCGGVRLPSGWPPAHTDDIELVLRVAAAVIGVLPADRRCFRLFVNLGRNQGFTTRVMADALALTQRRVRQLASQLDPNLEKGLAVLGSPVLCRVP